LDEAEAVLDDDVVEEAVDEVDEDEIPAAPRVISVV
jgi:hypothetical protein